MLEQLGALAQADDAGLRRAAVETALVRRVEGAWASAPYWAFTPGDSPFRRDALLWVALLGDAGVHRRLLEQLDRAEPREDVVWALGSCGRIAAVDRCVELLADAELGPLAGEVVCAIAGLARDEDRFWRPRPPADGEGQTLPAISAAELARDLVPTAEDALPQPRADVIASWWHERRAELDPALRHLGGRVLDRGVLVDALWREPLRRRHALALELSLRTAGGLWLPTRALSWAQREALDGLGELDGVELQRGWGLR